MSSPGSPLTAAAAASPDAAARRLWLFAVSIVATCLVFLSPLSRFVRYALSNDNASHTVLIPLICCWLLYVERDRIFRSPGSDVPAALAFFLAGAFTAAMAWFPGFHWSDLNRVSLYLFALLLLWVSAFAFWFGRRALRAARFPLTFLLFTIPFPDFLLDKVIYFLQKGTTEIAAVLFDWSGVPVIRDGFVFHLAHANIEIARECSGIRSSVALLLLAILVAHFYLRTFWKQALLVLVGLFVMILKNGVRVVTLTLLASYVDPSFLVGKLHRDGGVVFFLLGLALLAPLLWLLERGEPKTAAPASDSPAAQY
jgi:exosortase